MKWFKQNWFLLTVTALVLTGWVTYNVVAYDDWHCAISRCVRVENVRP